MPRPRIRLSLKREAERQKGRIECAKGNHIWVPRRAGGSWVDVCIRCTEVRK